MNCMNLCTQFFCIIIYTCMSPKRRAGKRSCRVKEPLRSLPFATPRISRARRSSAGHTLRSLRAAGRSGTERSAEAWVCYGDSEREERSAGNVGTWVALSCGRCCCSAPWPRCAGRRSSWPFGANPSAATRRGPPDMNTRSGRSTCAWVAARYC